MSRTQTLIAIMIALSTTTFSVAAKATRIDCEIKDSVEGISQRYRISTEQGVWNQLYRSNNVEYKVTEWWPNINRPIQLMLRMNISSKSLLSVGSSKDFVQLSIFDDQNEDARTIQCKPAQN